jgi:hypothetical protein
VNDPRKSAFFRWLFTPPEYPTSSRDAITWWERRRFSYNLIVGLTALIAFAVYCISISSTGVLAPGDDIIEPMAFMLAPLIVIFINICYTAGWLVDAPLRFCKPSLTPRFTSRLFILGFAFSLIVVSLPAVYWASYRLLQLVHIIH